MTLNRFIFVLCVQKIYQIFSRPVKEKEKIISNFVINE